MKYFTGSRVFALSHGNMKTEQTAAMVKKDDENQRSRSLFRYMDPLEEIQGEC